MTSKQRSAIQVKAAAKFDHVKAARKAWRLHKAVFAKAVKKMIATKKLNAQKLAKAA